MNSRSKQSPRDPSTRHSVTLLGPPGLGQAVAAEVTALGAECGRVRRGAVEARVDSEALYRILLMGRSVGRVLLPLGEIRADSDAALYQGAAAHAWEAEVPEGATIAVDFRGTGGWLRHSLHGARRIKDAMVDRIRDTGRRRPDVDPEAPDVLINARLHRGRVRLYRDLGGGSLHRRGYRGGDEAAPLKEHLAAAMLLMADWPARAEAGDGLLDPLCGSGTLVIEAAALAAGIPARGPEAFPGLASWAGHDLRAWNRVCGEVEGGTRPPEVAIAGSDHDPTALARAERNARTAGVADWIRLRRCPLTQADFPAERGLVVANLPYGHRIGHRAGVAGLAAGLGRRLRGAWAGRDSCLLVGDADPSALGLAPSQRHDTLNGALECHLLRLPGFPPEPDPEGQPFANRLQKNLRHLGKRFRRQGTDAFRCYDSDLPEFPGRLERLGEHVRLVPGAAGKDPVRAQRRVAAMVHQASRILDCPGDHVHVCPAGSESLESVTVQAREAGVPVRVRPADPVDPGLDPRGRLLRERAAERVGEHPFLHLYAGHALAALRCGKAGASQTLCLAPSPGVRAWIEQDLKQQGMPAERHRAGLMTPQTNALSASDLPWGLILFTPAEVDQRALDGAQVRQWLHAALARLAPGGQLLAWYPGDWQAPGQLPEGMVLQDLSRQLLPEDCRRDHAPGHFFQIAAERA